MRIALVNPHWSFEGSIYFGCREPHLPLEYGYARQMLELAGHEVALIDAQLERLPPDDMRERVATFAPEMTVVTTAPSYLFWRCAPPELRVPQQTVRTLREVGGLLVAIGPHGSTTPRAAIEKLGVEAVVCGESEEVLVRLAATPCGDWGRVPSIALRRSGTVVTQGGSHASDMASLPALRWSDDAIRRHDHHHHRFDAPPLGPGAEMETSRGCPYHCTFCAKDNFRDDFRRRPLPVILDELDALLAQGVAYVYFIDEIFLPNRPLLEALTQRHVKFGMQTRIDLWNEEMIELLGRAGCVSIEAGIESLTREGREELDKKCRLSTDELTERLIFTKQHVAFVQGNLIETACDQEVEVRRWREYLQTHGVWSNQPVPLFPYPGSPQYGRLWGPLDDRAWERAHAHYLGQFGSFSDIQEQRPLPLHELELAPFESA